MYIQILPGEKIAYHQEDLIEYTTEIVPLAMVERSNRRQIPTGDEVLTLARNMLPKTKCENCTNMLQA
jgi:hypothetical protein